jgi:hypothetical protein
VRSFRRILTMAGSKRAAIGEPQGTASGLESTIVSATAWGFVGHDILNGLSGAADEKNWRERALDLKTERRRSGVLDEFAAGLDQNLLELLLSVSVPLRIFNVGYFGFLYHSKRVAMGIRRCKALSAGRP